MALPARQRGVALLVVLTIFVLGIGYAAVSGLNTAAARSQRDDVTRRALLEAKEALLAYAAQDTRGVNWVDNDKIGSLPCPAKKIDTGAPFGAAIGNCSSNAAGGSTLVGRLPWRSLNIPELRDAAGEPLWYAVSSNYAKSSAYDSVKVNPETAGTIRLIGAAAGSDIVAVIMAPGAPTAGQSRSGADRDLPGNYIEGATIDNATAGPAPALDIFHSGPAAALPGYNDQLVTITRGELFAAIEARLALRVERTVLPQLNQHLATWGWLPYALKPVGSYFNPNAAILELSPPQTQGHLPIAPARTWLAWDNAVINQTSGVGVFSAAPLSCADPTSPTAADLSVTMACSRTYELGPMNVSFEITLLKGAATLMDDVVATVATSQGTLTATRTVTIVDGNLRIAYDAALPAPVAATETVTFTVAATHSTLNGYNAGTDLVWFVTNDWHRAVFYAVSDDVKPGGAPTCAANCLTAKRPDGSTTAARAVLVIAGQPVEKTPGQWQMRPGVTADYFEGINATLPRLDFNQSVRAFNFNDRVVPLPNS